MLILLMLIHLFTNSAEMAKVCLGRQSAEGIAEAWSNTRYGEL